MSLNKESEIIQYTLQAGDTVWDLADQYGTTTEDIVAVNPRVDFNNLLIGQAINIPSDKRVSSEQFRGFRHGFGRPFGFRRRFFRGPLGFRRPFSWGFGVPYYPYPYNYYYPYPYPYVMPFADDEDYD